MPHAVGLIQGSRSWSVTVVAASEAEAVELALERARMVNRESGLPPHGLRVNERELRQLACVLPRGPAGPGTPAHRGGMEQFPGS